MILVAMGLVGLTNQLFWLSFAMILLAIGGIITVFQRIFEVKHGLDIKDK